MSNKNTCRRINYNGFFGIDTRRSHGGKENLYDIENFRIMDDDSIQKRNGYKPIFTAEKVVRAIWSGYLSGEFLCFFLAGNSIYRLDINDKSAEKLCEISTQEGKASFFFFKNSLYLSDEEALYSISHSEAHQSIGYVPLFGKDWPTSLPGEINEELNSLNYCARITYIVPPGFTGFLPTVYPVERIISVIKNDIVLSPDSYYFEPRYNAIALPGLSPDDNITACVKYAPENEFQLTSCPYAGTYGEMNDTKLIFWGGIQPNKIFINENVSQDAAASSEELFPGCGDLYYPERKGFVVGDGLHEIKALVRHFDRLLILTDGDAWMANGIAVAEDAFPAMTINTNAGCASNNGVIRYGNDPISIGHHAILRWNSKTDEINECSAYSISTPIESLLSPDFFKNAIIFFDERRNEVWFQNSSVDTSAWIYNLNKKAWVRFSDISASLFFNSGNDIGFIREKTIYIFSDDCTEDTFDDETHEIVGSITAYNMDFESSAPKRLSSFTIWGELDSGSVNTEIETAEGEKITFDISDPNDHSINKIRLHSSRFSFLRKLYITAKGQARQVLHKIYLDAR